MSQPQSAPPARFEIAILPGFTDDPAETPAPLRTGTVDYTGVDGVTGYPRYTGDGLAADIDPENAAVEALLVDGRELDYGLIARATAVA